MTKSAPQSSSEIAALLLAQIADCQAGRNLAEAIAVCKSVDTLISLARLQMDYSKLRGEKPAVAFMDIAPRMIEARHHEPPRVEPPVEAPAVTDAVKEKVVINKNATSIEHAITAAVAELTTDSNSEFSREDLTLILEKHQGNRVKQWIQAGSVAATVTNLRSADVIELVRRTPGNCIYRRGRRWEWWLKKLNVA